MRVLLFTGKGGVGKTTVAAATAVGPPVRAPHADHVDRPGALARRLVRGRDRVQPTEITPNLWATQIDAQERLEDNWREIQDYFIQLMNWAGTETIQAEELTVIPGLDEIFALIDVKTHVESGAYDMLVVDCAPTAETLRLLSLPEIMNWYIERIFPVERKVVKAVRPIVSKDDHAADRGRQGVRGGRAPAPQPRRREDDPHRRSGVVGTLVVNPRRW
jgi:arsenite-transporting ATPase